MCHFKGLILSQIPSELSHDFLGESAEAALRLPVDTRRRRPHHDGREREARGAGLKHEGCRAETRPEPGTSCPPTPQPAFCHSQGPPAQQEQGTAGENGPETPDYEV